MRVLFLNPQGNFDNNDSYWTSHPDFGGQLVYVKEVALNLAQLGVNVDIITRRIRDPKWPEFNEELIENYQGNSKVRIIRIAFGGDKFLNKEELWPYVANEYVDGIIRFYKQEGTKADAITTHYGDGGIAGAILGMKWDIPFTFTGHSLGAQKMDKLGVNKNNIEGFDTKYSFSKRILAERIAMNRSATNIVSTEQERFQQYSHKLYEGAIDIKNDRKFKIIPPGVNTEVFDFNEKQLDAQNVKYIKGMLRRDIESDRVNLPCIVLASRFDQKKNHIGAVKAYADNKFLQEKANLVIMLRGIDNPFDDYHLLKTEEKFIMDEIMDIINKNCLKGKVSMFSVDGQLRLGSTYRILTKLRSIFCLTSVYEPFGLAPIEAMHAGLPVVVTKNGGPVEITDNGKYGVLVDPESTEEIAQGMIQALLNFDHYHKLGIKRVEEKYTWKNAAIKYLHVIEKAIQDKEPINDYFINKSTEDELKEKLKELY